MEMCSHLREQTLLQIFQVQFSAFMLGSSQLLVITDQGIQCQYPQ